MEKNNNINPDSMIPMYKQIVNLLNEKIEKGELKPGDKLPSEAELMEAYSVSRITIRSAISELEEDGLVIRSRGKGTFIASKKAMYSADDTVGCDNRYGNCYSHSFRYCCFHASDGCGGVFT